VVGAQGAHRPEGWSGTGLRVAGAVRPAGDRALTRGGVRPSGPLAGAPAARRDAVRPGARPVRLEPAPFRRSTARAGRDRRAAPGSGPLRLTRRGWWVATASAVVLSALAVLALSALLGARGGLDLAGSGSVVVQPGDTVWSIAVAVAGPGEDVRRVVDAIEELNGLAEAVVVPGQVLRVP
jgi:nucleoid-associated protein YgaU